MNNKIIPIILIGLIAISCNQERKIEVVAGSITEYDLAICKDSKCPEITINYLKVLGNDPVATKINEKLNKFIISSLASGEDGAPKGKTIEEAATAFVEAYQSDKSRFPDMAADYFAEISITELYNSPSHISFELRQYLYTGGAHGYGTTSFININPETGNELSEKDIFKNKNEFTVFAEKKFREQQNISQDQAINDPGFWFENNAFYLPESVGFTQDSLIFVYNQYDIASYADGPIELKIAMKDVSPYLNVK